MWCPSPRGGKGDARAIAFTALMAAVSSWIGDPTSLDRAIDSNSSSAMQNYSSDDAISMSSSASTSSMQDQEEGYCENEIISSNWEWHCGTEIIIWTSVKPEDLFAIAALFAQADLMMQTLDCVDEQYPIKAIIAGGGILDYEYTPILEKYLQDLRRARLMPGDKRFQISTQIYDGPRPREELSGRDVAAVAAWTEGDLESLPERDSERRGSWPSTIRVAMESLVGRIIDLLAKQDAPIFVALRPIVEYGVLWTETTRLSNAETFPLTADYMEHRRDAWEWQALQASQDPARLARAAMRAFKRSRIITTIKQFEEMGTFFGDRIMAGNSEEHRVQEVLNLEKSFLTLPRQVILVDAKDNHGVGFWGHDHVFAASFQAAIFERLRAVPEASTRLLKYVALWNKPTIDWDVERTQDLLTSVSSSKRVTVERFDELVTQASRLSTELVEGTAGNDDAGIRTWKDAVHALRRDIVSLTLRMTGNDRHHRVGLALWARRLRRWYDTWADFALHQASFVKAPNLFIPFFVGPRHWQIRDSIAQVSFDGWSEEDGYSWGTTDVAQSTIWLARSSDLGDRRQTEERWAQIRHDVEQLYCEAFDPDFHPGSGPGV